MLLVSVFVRGVLVTQKPVCHFYCRCDEGRGGVGKGGEGRGGVGRGREGRGREGRAAGFLTAHDSHHPRALPFLPFIYLYIATLNLEKSHLLTLLFPSRRWDSSNPVITAKHATSPRHVEKVTRPFMLPVKMS